MRLKNWVLAAAVVAGLSGCGDGDRNSLVIEGDTVNEGPGTTPPPTGGTSTCPDFASARPVDADGNNVCQLPQTIAADTTLTADTVWYLADRVTVGNGNNELADRTVDTAPWVLSNGLPLQNVTLTIEAGTQIKARNGTFANMIITRGSRIMAEGTADAPIVFSSEDADFDGSGEWGGLILQGH